jgi:hypothetical protein
MRLVRNDKIPWKKARQKREKDKREMVWGRGPGLAKVRLTM